MTPHSLTARFMDKLPRIAGLLVLLVFARGAAAQELPPASGIEVPVFSDPVLTIDFYAPTTGLPFQDGTVVAIQVDGDHWTFATVYTPDDGYHPVSGNREFGFTNNGDGTITFYTRGVDRISTSLFEMGDALLSQLGPSGFEQADALWTSFVTSIAADLNQAAGGVVATVDAAEKNRPDYDTVADLFDGDPANDQAALASLGCD